VSEQDRTHAAATAVSTHNAEIPMAGEDIHLPPGTPLPLLVAIGITLILVGTTTSWLWSYVGGAIFLIALVLWIRDTIQEVHHLPEEHVVPTAQGADPARRSSAGH
jgi:hypothetical protein